MIEIGFYLIGVMFAGYTMGSVFVKVLSKIRFYYNIKNYSIMIIYILTLPFIPLLFVVMIIMTGIGVETFYVLATGQL